MLLSIEQLEQRTLLAAAPDVYEQYLIALINRARTGPAGEAARYKVALNEGVPADHLISDTPKSPLAINLHLQQAAQDHSQWMLDADVFSHEGANGSAPPDRDMAAGYVFNAPSAWGENIGFSGQTGALPEVMAAIERLHRNFFVDAGIENRTHRTTLLQDFFNEVLVELKRPVDEVLQKASDAGILAGYPVGRDYPELGNCLLVAFTEKRTRAEIDRLVSVL